MVTNGSRSDIQPFATYTRVQQLKNGKGNAVAVVDGHSLSVADVVAVARHGVKAEASSAKAVRDRVDASVAFLESKKHMSIYGVTTGFGGSADTRTGDWMALQVSLLEHQLCGYLPPSATYEQMLIHAMPIPIVRGAILIRVNSLVRGHSGVRWKVLQALLNFLNNGLVPCVPLRGSISASGDLSPLSYVAGAICGHPDVKVFETSTKTILLAEEAIAKYNLEKIVLGPKEGLGLVNGTAFSASAGSLALYDAENLAVLTQTTTAMTVEAMVGHVGSFDEFIHDVTRPHPGQIQAARNIRDMLEGSKLAVHSEDEVALQEDAGVLRQDRYALRTSAQWIGPNLETLVLARQQIEIELNSTTDNPLLDVENGRIAHGGNFQATAVTQAMDATRLVLEHLGRLSFAQITELINCQMNRGLPSCLAGDEPSTNYHTKGLDIHSAAYTSELGYLANPVSTHVQSTEMHNQSVNSLALISARKTLEAVDVLSLLLSTHLYCATQAIDLRIMDLAFQKELRSLLESLNKKHFGSLVASESLSSLNRSIFTAIVKRLEETPSWDSGARFADAARHLVGHVVEVLATSKDGSRALQNISNWQKELTDSSTELYRRLRKEATSGRDNVAKAKENMGQTFAVYNAVRREFGVSVRRGDVAEGRHLHSIGSSVSAIVEGVRDGRVLRAAGVALRMVNDHANGNDESLALASPTSKEQKKDAVLFY